MMSTPPTNHHKSLHRSSISDSDDGPGRERVLKKLQIATALCFIFLLVEVVGGWLAGSLAILSDASHLFADLASFCVAIVASHLASLPSTTTHTFGLQRAESLAALISMLSLAVVSVGLAFEALRRLLDTSREEKVDGPLMSGIAAIGVFVNVILAFVLGEQHVHMPGASHAHGHDDHTHHDHNHRHEHNHHETSHNRDHDCGDHIVIPTHDHKHEHHHHHSADHVENEEEEILLSDCIGHIENYNTVVHKDKVLSEENINLKAAYLHVLGDLAQSLAVLAAGIILWVFPQAQIVDPLCTLLFCVLVFYSTLSVLRSSVAVLLEEIPPKVDWMKVYNAISGVPDVLDVHDLHIWCISHGEPSLSVHCVSQRPDLDEVLKDIYSICKQFGISHATIQIQRSSDYCITCSPCAKSVPRLL